MRGTSVLYCKHGAHSPPSGTIKNYMQTNDWDAFEFYFTDSISGFDSVF